MLKNVFKDFTEERHTVFANINRVFKLTVVALVALYFASGVYSIGASEAGVVRRFGKPTVATVKPGIHYRLPWPVDKIDKISIREVKRVEVGFWPTDPYAVFAEMLPYCITGDKNILHSRFVVQYRIEDPVAFLFDAVEPDIILRKLVDGIIIEEIATRPVDPVLTTGKREIELAIQERLQKEVAQMGIGIAVVSVETRKIEPPAMVIEAFKEVTNAREEKSTVTHQAEEEQYKLKSRAEADAKKVVEEAKAYKYQRISAAEGEAERFLSLYGKYRLAPELTRKRLFLDMMEQMLPNVKIYVLSTDARGRTLRLKLIQGAMPTRPILDLNK